MARSPSVQLPLRGMSCEFFVIFISRDYHDRFLFTLIRAWLSWMQSSRDKATQSRRPTKNGMVPFVAPVSAKEKRTTLILSFVSLVSIHLRIHSLKSRARFSKQCSGTGS